MSPALLLLLVFAAVPAALAIALWRRGRRVASGFVVVLGYTLLGAAIPTFPEDVAKHRNFLACVRATNLHAAVEAYRADHGGRPPATHGWIDQLRAPGQDYLAGYGAPPNVWAEAVQPAWYGVEPPLVGAAAIAAGASPTPRGTVLGPGRNPRVAGFGPRAFGAYLYDADPRSGAWVLYVVGQHGYDGEAEVAGWATHRETDLRRH